MAFYRKLRKLIRDPKLFFEDARKKKLIAASAVAAATSRPVPKPVAKAPVKPAAKVVKQQNFSTWLAHARSVRVFSNAFPVNTIKHRGLHMWPALRFYIWLRLICAILGKAIKNKNLISASPSMVWRKNYIQQNDAVCVDDFDGSSNKVDFLVFSNQNSIDLCVVGDVSYNKFSDPLYDRLLEYGTVQKVEFLKGQGPLPNRRYITPRYVLPSIVRSTRHHLLVDGLSDAVPAMVQAFPAAELTESVINFYVDEFFNIKESFKKILQEYQPKCVFFSPIDYSFPLIVACKECGVVAVDIQHGNHVGFNLPYNHWDEAPVKGYDMFPDAFLGWGSREKKAFAKTFPSTRVVTAGFPWLDYFHDLTHDRPDVLAKSLRKLGEYRHMVAITMRDQIDFPTLLRDIVMDPRAEETGTVFLIKPHPKNDRLAGIPDSKNVFMPKEIKATSIAELAKHVDLHMTVNSSSIFEFEYYGVPSFVFDQEPLVDYADLIEEGRLTHITSADEFYAALETLSDRPAFEPLINNDSTDFTDFMSELGFQKPVVTTVAA